MEVFVFWSSELILRRPLRRPNQGGYSWLVDSDLGLNFIDAAILDLYVVQCQSWGGSASVGHDHQQPTVVLPVAYSTMNGSSTKAFVFWREEGRSAVRFSDPMFYSVVQINKNVL